MTVNIVLYFGDARRTRNPPVMVASHVNPLDCLAAKSRLIFSLTEDESLRFILLYCSDPS